MMSEQHLFGSGADGQFLGDFRALAQATARSGEAKYSRLVLERLALFLVGHGGARNRDAPLFELCHLVNILHGSGGDGAARWQFFLSPDPMTPARCKLELEAMPNTGRSGDDGVAAIYGADEFLVTFGRMPFLVALYDFLASMDDFAFHDQLNRVFDEMVEDGGRMRAIQDGANGLAAAMREYRSQHLEQGMHDDAFMAILNYLRERADGGEGGKGDGGEGGRRLDFADDDILQFWCRHNQGEFRTYRRAFQRFADFTTAMATTRARRAGETPLRLGSDREMGEVEPDDLHNDPADFDNLAAWSDPLTLLDSGPAAEIKFFTASGEREPLAPLTEFGPFARRLPLAFLRYVAFGSVQAAITTALQFHPGDAVETNLLACGTAEPYVDRRALYEKLHGHLARLEKATFHVLRHGAGAGDGIITLSDPAPGAMFEAARRRIEQDADITEGQLAALEAEAAKAFKQIARRGFEEEALDSDDRREGFRIGAGVLYAVGQVLDGYLGGLAQLERDSGLDRQFRLDALAFAGQFSKLYGVRDDRDRNAG